MLHGPLLKKIIFFALPIAASSILQQLFNAADVAVAGRFAESGALAAVGSNSVLVGLFVNLFVGLSVGTNVVIAQYIGQKRTQEVGTVVHTSMLFSMICGLVMMAAGLALSRFLLVLVDTPEDVLERALLYLRIYCVGMVFIIPYNFGAAILRSIGDTRRPLYCLIASGLLNICLNLLLVIKFHLGVAGVAIATVISNAFSASVVLYILCHESEMIRLYRNRLRIHNDALKKIVQIGAPAALQSAVFSISNICIQTAVNRFGSGAVAGMTAALNFEYLGYFIVSAFAQTIVTFIGQNYGAGQYERCKKILRLCLIGAATGTILVISVFILARGELIRIFTVDPVEIEYAMARFLYVMPFLFLTSTYEVVGSALRGMGRSTLPAVFTLLGMVVFRVFWVYVVFPLWSSFQTLIIVYPVSWALTGGMMLLYYVSQRGRLFAA
ncbi:MAG: MATE family efflux transporter [Roseburia sp.]|nr:MATE family efflux transporter [Roseburia sp.]